MSVCLSPGGLLRCARTVTRYYGRLRAAGCNLQPPVNIPVEILSIAKARLWPIWPPPGQNVQGSNHGADASEPVSGPTPDGWTKCPPLDQSTILTRSTSNRPGPDLLISRLRSFLGPSRKALAERLYRVIPLADLACALDRCQAAAAVRPIGNRGGYLCKVLNYTKEVSRGEIEKKAPVGANRIE